MLRISIKYMVLNYFFVEILAVSNKIFKKHIYLFIQKSKLQVEREKQDRNIWYPLVHSS